MWRRQYAVPAPDAVVDERANGKKPARKKEPAAEEAPPAPAIDGQLLDTIYQALMGLGHNPIEARTRIDNLLTSGKTFANFQDAMTLIYSQK